MTWVVKAGAAAAATIILLSAAACQRPPGRGIDDVALAQAVRERFTANSDLRGATERVLVKAKDGTVNLSGTTDTAADKVLAESVAQGTKDVVKVVNEIIVTGQAGSTRNLPLNEEAVRARAEANGEKIGGAVDDPRIYSEVCRKVVAEPATPKKAIFVDVVNGNVTLRGMVFSLEARDEAVRAARTTEGVNAVRDLLKVNAPGLSIRRLSRLALISQCRAELGSI